MELQAFGKSPGIVDPDLGTREVAAYADGRSR